MRKLSKRKIIAATGVLGATAAIAVPATIVYTTKDTLTKPEIGLNVEREIENEILSSIKLMPSNQFGTFNSGRLSDHEKRLDTLESKVEALTKEFNIRVKSRMPIYGILNDVLMVSTRFDTWNDFVSKIKDIIGDINNENWVKLEKDLFDSENKGAQRILSPDYGILRSDVDDKTVDMTEGLTGVSDSEKERINYGVENSFVSFGEYVDALKNGDKENQDAMVQTIISTLNMMTGTPIENSTGKWVLNNVLTSAPSNSVVYMAESLSSITATDNQKHVADIWNNQVLKAWSQRYRAIDQFFNVNTQPIGKDGKFDSKEDLEAYKIYEKQFAEGNTQEGLTDAIESFLDGRPMVGTKPTFVSGKTTIQNIDITESEWDGTSNRFLTNWEFLRVLFGNSFDLAIDAKAPKQIDSAKSGMGWDTLLETHSTIKITDASGSGILVNKYFADVMKNIFAGTNTKISKFVKRHVSADATSPLVKKTISSGIADALKDDRDFQNSYDALKKANDEYITESDKINSDSFRIGIKLDEFKKLIKSFDLDDGWNIQIHSLISRGITQESINKVMGALKYKPDKKTLMENPDGYTIDGGYIYPDPLVLGQEWLISSSDSISVGGLKFNKNSRLKQFESVLGTARIFKPELILEQDMDKATISIKWNTTGTVSKGGSND